ncbi:nitroreductase [Frigidibacter sp. ROC022]|uniref:nitroreductase n=1 Tax=Frigidibacter sp. ROC022 TaxID=2971796 RepID=UPI00215AEC1A|nr:nitroreductase [Frigidibacter sp. ROC022]MCR8726741.1 nitroreductase [Frigidibacter sp. ROC022]
MKQEHVAIAEPRARQVASQPVPAIWNCLNEVIRSRHSIRAYRDKPVTAGVIREILETSSYAPSGANAQPWRVHLLGQSAIHRVEQAVIATEVPPHRAVSENFKYYPDRFLEPYKSRRSEIGAALYQTLGIGRRDVQRMRSQFMKNYRFFGAPVGLIVTMSRHLETGMFLDLGMFLQNVMLCARAKGLDTCVQAAFAPYDQAIRNAIPIPEDEFVVCGMAVGHRDPASLENRLQSPRAPLESWLTSHVENAEESICDLQTGKR